MPVYDYQGNEVQTESVGVSDFDRTVKGIAHMGFSSVAPQNTLPSYRLAKEKGFFYVECDISFTSDGVAVLLHDATINATSNGTGNIGDMTWEQVQQYDFGSWKSPVYAGTKIPSFEQFIRLCRDIQLHPYIELKNNATYTEAQIQGLVDIVNAHGMRGKVTWISFQTSYLNYVKNYDDEARLGFLVFNVTSSSITTANGLKTGKNEVIIDSQHYTDAECALCANAKIPLEVWTIDSASTIQSMNPYVSGVTSNTLHAGKVLYDASMQ